MMEKYITADIEYQAQQSQLGSFKKVYKIEKKGNVKKWLYGMLIILILAMLLPWTQNIRAKGTITTLRQEQRPQELNTIIAGRVLKWYVKEGDFVKEGDTILQLGEVKVDYFDPQLLSRTQQQIDAKQQSIEGYKSKAGTAETQTSALLQGQYLKLQSLDNKLLQQQLKVTSDSTDLLAVNNELGVYKRQIDAAKLMLDSGVISLVDFEKRRMNYQNAAAKKISAENKYSQSKQELIILRIEKNSTIQEYTDKISKAEGDKYSSLSNAASTEADVAKLKNIYSSYDARNQLYYIKAPQNGQVTKAKKAGIGEILKEGEMVVEIVPTNIQYAVEMFIEPMDLPLINMGQKVRFVFDGFPAIVFSGWPTNSYGTFGGKVSAVETAVSSNGKFRVLVAEDPDDRKWPQQLRMGGSASGIALLKDVRIYYELWRNINGFPPDYYKQAENKETQNSKYE
ncbi:HlyD family efflux transporter periplasmic adaptor subunit [Ferruginibacter paludis]|uniref:HlyD family secretion protein n=1 Tax=Ferruginibacter paludis TaxID=1310417 RepID=UPI0025B41A6D|nr:HlyD family efflux transporter periplasmic adaptor subunit [Ferruginibacter paludis]MDN3655346.1 HlyD family efflux transporter periplasmic adaptor subunit [Ferruginibacter paludis]